jgi:hypothetical protein
MKQFIKLLPVITVLWCACTKKQSFSGTAALTLINAVPNSTPSLVTNFGGTEPLTWYRNALKLVYGTVNKTNQSLPYSGEQRLAIFRYPDTLAHNTPLYDLTLDLQPGTIYTLFLTGSLSSPDTMLTIDNPPYYAPADSSLGIRFVNLMAGSAPVSVNLAGSATGSEASGLSYKNITGFNKYVATAAVSKYTFEFRNTATGVLISSFDVAGINTVTPTNQRRFRNFTVALMGSPADPTTHKVMLIDTYTSLNL